MGVQRYSTKVGPKPPDRFFLFGEMCKVVGYGEESGKPGSSPPYILENRSWIEGSRYAVVVRNGEVIEEGPASQIKPSKGDFIVAAKGGGNRILPSQPGAFRVPEYGDVDWNNFPEDGVLVRGANGVVREVYMGDKAFQEYVQFVLMALNF